MNFHKGDMMTTGNNYEKAVSDFTTFLYQKGYRGDYMMDKVSGQPPKRGRLPECLKAYIRGHQADAANPEPLQLETQPPYEPKIRCLFKIAFDEVKGFLVREMEIVHTEQQSSKHYRISHNQQVPGSKSVAALFPRPKPWDNHIKGKFKL